MHSPKLTTQMELSGGTAQRIADRQLDTFQGQMTLMRSAVEALLLSVGSRLVPVLEPLIASVTAVVQRFAEWSETMPGLSSAVVITVVALGALALVGGCQPHCGWRTGWRNRQPGNHDARGNGCGDGDVGSHNRTRRADYLGHPWAGRGRRLPL